MQSKNIFGDFKDILKKVDKTDFTQLYCECVKHASHRTKEYLAFKDPENTFHPSPTVLSDIFQMAYITRSVQLQLTRHLNCTTMTKEQVILLGTDWVWAVLHFPTKNPKLQIAVQVFHQTEEENCVPSNQTQMLTESMEIATLESSDKTKQEKMIAFCSSVGRDCYALFLFFGLPKDPTNIYGVLSNNFQAAFGKGAKIDRAFIENFFKGSISYSTPGKMIQSILNNGKEHEEPLTMLVKFT
ncbi:rab15 effector protein [Huso huso]|uniref:Rab15 effector protein n=1 Tax=Huso huso TaxID=61971 RepID=A0ABR0YK64_HUSHU